MPLHFFLLWFLLVFSAGRFFFPFSLRIFGAVLPDGGLAVGRVLFLAFSTLGAFWAGHFGVSTRNGCLVGFALAIIGFLLTWRRREELKTELRARKRAIWASETIFILVFLAFFALRGFWSDTNGTNGEKSMDSALIGSLMRAERLPPPNPYAAGATLNSYYYFGHFQTALLSSAFDTPVRWSYNLMCATLPALCFSTLFSLGAALTKRLRSGFFVAASVLGLGTLQPLIQWLRPEKFGASAPFRLDFFAVSRVIPYSINEFPFFTFNQADLHAHYFALPLALATICFGLAIYRGQKLAIGPATLILGAQILTNTWDFPVYALLIAFCVAAQQKSTKNEETEIQATKNHATTARFPDLARRFVIISVVWLGALLLAAPYLLGIKTAANPPRLLAFPASPLREWGLLWGVFAVSWLAFLAYSWDEASKLRQFCTVLGGLFALYALAIPWERPDPFVLPLILFLLIFSVCSAARFHGHARFLCFLAMLGLLALAWSETTWAGFLGDAQNRGFDDFKRQDTVFKFGMQTWILWGIAASCGAVLTFKQWPNALRILAMPALGVMAIASVAAVFGRARNFEKWDGWDAWAHLAPSEKAAASWLLNHVSPGQNLLEAEQMEGGDYSPYSRYSSATGIPTVVGPQAHTFQWSPANSGKTDKEWAEVARRKATVRAIYSDLSGIRRASALQSFGARFIIFGELERDQYGVRALQSLQNDADLVRVAHFEAPPNRSNQGFFTPREVWIFRTR